MAKKNNKSKSKATKPVQGKTTKKTQNIAKSQPQNKRKAKKRPKKITGKIGYCDNKNLGLNNMRGGHYVYIRKKNGDECSVNVITSLEDSQQNFIKTKIEKVKKGYLYPIPTTDATFNRWSAINLDTIKNVDVNNVREIGEKNIKRRHKWFVGKFAKK